MKKILSLILALVMVASMAAVAASADILYEDDFEDEDFNYYNHSTGEGFWFLNPENGGSGMGKFEIEDGKMTGWEDAQNGFSQYWGGEKDGTFLDQYPCLHEFTEWFDLELDEGGIGDTYCFGIILSDPKDYASGYTTTADRYYAALYAIDDTEQDGEGNSHTGFARLTYSTPRRDKKLNVYSQNVGGDYILGTYDIPGLDGFNKGSDPVRIGVRFGNGNITMYANGRIVASYDRETIGTEVTPAVWLQNGGCYVEIDNYVLATYDHNVKAATRLEDNAEVTYSNPFEPYEGTVVITDGEFTYPINAAEDDELTITPPAIFGKEFVKWDSISIDGVEITDFEKAELLYGIEIGDIAENSFALTMPDADVTIHATYKDADTSGYLLTATDIVVAERYVNEGETVTLTAAEPDEYMGSKVFGKWVVNKGGVVLDDPYAKTISFTMPAEAVEVQAKYVDMGDVDGDGNINARDVILVMRASLPGFTAPADYVAAAADMDNDKTINARDVIEVMKAALAAATGK